MCGTHHHYFWNPSILGPFEAQFDVEGASLCCLFDVSGENFAVWNSSFYKKLDSHCNIDLQNRRLDLDFPSRAFPRSWFFHRPHNLVRRFWNAFWRRVMPYSVRMWPSMETNRSNPWTHLEFFSGWILCTYSGRWNVSYLCISWCLSTICCYFDGRGKSCKQHPGEHSNSCMGSAI